MVKGTLAASMATIQPGSPSPRVSPQAFAGHLITPGHSPRHSIASSTSSRTPAYALTLHEYRKQQNTPVVPEETTLRKTIRRKAAADTLDLVELTPLLANASSLRPSQSTQQPHSHLAPRPHNALPNLSLYVPPTDLHAQRRSISSTSTVHSVEEVRNLSARNRLSRPPAATGPVLSSSPPTHRQTPHLQPSLLPTSLPLSPEKRYSSEVQTTPTHSTFSLSQFPKPPQQINPSFSPPYNDPGFSRVNALSYSTNAPATPPATPATLHYCGASFDLVNPHYSLLLHNIVTPSWQFDSTEHLLSQESEDFFTETAEMAHKRPLYNDINSARAGIMRRPGDGLDESSLEAPLYPEPAAVSPNSSAYTAPLYSPEFVHAPSPLAIRKLTNDSRFSLKQLTRSLTKKIVKSPDKDCEEELQEFSHGFPRVSREEEPQQPPAYPYVSTPQASYFPPSASSPITSTGPEVYRAFGVEYRAMSPLSRGVQHPRRHTYSSEPLASLITDDPSTQVGRMEDSQALLPEQTTVTNPYYDDLDSIYPSSSIYTGDGQRQSRYQESLIGNRQSNPYLRLSLLNPNGMANEYNRGSVGDFSDNPRQSEQPSGLLTQELYHRSVHQGHPKTDTISKLIDEYSPTELASNPSQTGLDRAIISYKDSMAKSSAFGDDYSVNRRENRGRFSEESQFEFESHQDAECCDDPGLIRVGSVPTSRPTITRDAGLPPCQALPFAPAFQYDEAPFIPPRADISGMFSNDSANSYGDTRNLLQMGHSDAALQEVPTRAIEPSSSYSQTEAGALEPSSSYSQPAPQSPHTPQQALEDASRIFRDVIAAHKRQEEEDIPAMWARRSSGGQLLSKKILSQPSNVSQDADAGSFRHSKDVTMERADWETVGGNSQGECDSLDSLADYSSSSCASTRNSLEKNAGIPLPDWDASRSRRLSRYSHHSRRLPNQPTSPFASSPRTAPTLSASPPPSSPPGSRTAPSFHFSNLPGQILGRGAVEEPYAFTPWADPYALSDKETQELLASGPNDNIIIESDTGTPEPLSSINHQNSRRDVLATSSPFESSSANSVGLERVNTFEKYSVVGPMGNLTGTPHGTGMQNTGSSIADNSSPGLKLSSTVGRNKVRNERSEYTGFYATPFPAVGSITSINQPRRHREVKEERPPSQMTLFSSGDEGSPVRNSPSPLSAARNRRQPLRFSTTFHRARRMSRPAVPGQTKLRQMFLAGEGRATASSQRTNFSRLLTASDRPSTSDTNTPLYRSHRNMDSLPHVIRRPMAHQNSPHLLCLEREANAEDEARRRKLSWAIFAMFCILPPCIILYRFLGDGVIASVTKGRLGHTTAETKRTALIAGIAANVGLITAILVPVLVANAVKAV